MNELLIRFRRLVPLFVGGVSGIFLTFGFTIIGWLIFIIAALIQDHIISMERDD